jgi:glutaredoxin
VRRVVLYSRPGCHLCDEARALLADIAAEAPDLVIEEVDIDADDELLRRYLERIPVIELNGRTVAELVPDPQEVRATLLQTSGA